MTRHYRGLAATVLAALAVQACDDTIPQLGPGVVVEVRVSPDTVALRVGATRTLLAVPLDATGSLLPGKNVSWSTSDASIASVDSKGGVTGVNPGRATITAMIDGIEGGAETVVDLAPSIALSRDSLVLTAQAGEADPPPDTVVITNGGGFDLIGLTVGAVSYFDSVTGWLNVTLDSAEAPAHLVLSAMTTSFTTPMDLSARIEIESFDAINTPLALIVRLAVQPGPAAGGVAVSGSSQGGTAGGAAGDPPSVTVTDQFGNGVPGMDVIFTVTGGGGSITDSVQVTDPQGTATVGGWVLGNVVGPNTLEAHFPGLSLPPIVFNATSQPGTPTQIVGSAGDGQTATVGSAVPVAPAVTLTDQFGNLVEGATVAFTVVQGGGSVAGSSPLTGTDGTATVGSWTLGLPAGPNGLRATVDGVADTVVFAATGVAGAADTVFASAGDGQFAEAGSAVAVAPAVTVTDEFGNPVSGVTVTFSITSGGGAITDSVKTTGADGVATLGSWTLGTAPGVNTINVSAPGLLGSPVPFVATATVGAAANIALNAGDNETATVGTPVSLAPSVLVTDQFGNPAAGVTVTFAVASGGGNVTAASQSTDASGIATVGAWTLGTVPGTNTLTATAAGGTVAGNPVTFTATATVGAAAQIAANDGDGQSSTVGSAVGTAPSVLVSDQFGNPVASVAVTFAVPSGGGGGSITGAAQTTDAGGIARVGTWTLGTAVGTNTLEATSTGLTGSPVTFTATGTVDVASAITMNAGNGQSAEVGTAVPVPPSVIVTDQFGNPVAGAPVTFAVTVGGGAVVPTTPVNTGADGVASATSWTLGNTPGPNTLQATSGSLTGSPVSFTATGTAGGAAQVAVNQGDGQTANAGTAVAVPPSVIVTDQFGNPVQGASVTFAVASGGGSVNPTTPLTTDASGVATVTSWTLGTVPVTNTLSATVVGAGITGNPVTFTATGIVGPAANIAVNDGNNQSAPVTTAVTIAPSVVVTDQFGNPVSGTAVTFGVTSGSGVVGPTTPITTDASGIARVTSWTLGPSVGTNTLQATTGLALFGEPVTFTANGSSGAPATVVMSAGNNQTATVGTAVSVAPAVLVTDATSNPVQGVTVTFAPASGGGSVTGAVQTTNASGIATVASWTLGTAAGANSLSATVSGAGITGNPVLFSATATAGSATTIAMNAGNGQSATVGTAVAVAPSAFVSDQFGNPVAGVSVNFAVTGGGGSALGGNQTTNAGGVATVTSWTLGSVAGANTLSATTGIPLTNEPLAFTATGLAGAPAALSVAVQPSAAAQSGVNFVQQPSVQLVDGFGNAVSQASVTIDAALGSGSGGGLGGTTAATTNASGLATFVDLAITGPVGDYTLDFTSTGLGVTSSGTITLSAGAASTIALNTGDGQSATVNNAVTLAPSVLVTDGGGNPVSGVSVTFGVTAGGGGVTGGSAATTASGIATVGSWTLGQTAGNNTLQATTGLTLTGEPVTFTATGVADAAATISMNAGNNQTATAGAAVAVPPSVLVVDQFGNAVLGHQVTFAVASGGGAVTGAVQNTNASGIAAVGSWTLGIVAGSNTLTATAAGVSITNNPLTFTATGQAGAAGQLAIDQQPSAVGLAGIALATQPMIQLQDVGGNPVTTAGINVTAAITSGPGGTIGGTVTVATDAAGEAVFTNLSIDGPVGSYTIGFSAPFVSGVTSNPVTVTAGTAAIVAIDGGDAQSATVNTAVTTAASAIVTDAFGNPVAGVGVTFAVTGGAGAVVPTTSISTNAAGIAQVTSWTLGTTAGANTLSATSGTLSGSPLTFTATGTADAPASVAVNGGDGQTATVGTAVAVDPSVIVRDQFSNVVPGAGVTFAVALGGGGVTGAVQSTNAAGIATVASWSMGTAPGSNQLTATVTGVGITNNPITFAATATVGSATTIALDGGDGQSATVNTAVLTTPSVLVTDVFGNPVPSVGVTFAVFAGGGVATGGAATTNGSGIATVASWTLGTTAGTNTLRATSTGLSGSPVAFTATATADVPATVAISAGDGQSATVNTAVAVAPAVLVVDQFGNPVPGAEVTYAVTGGAGVVVPTTGVNSDASGIAAATSWTLGTAAGANTLSATVTGAGVTGNPITFTATGTVAAAQTIAINGGNGQSATVNTAVATAPSVIVTDQFGNPVPGVSVTFGVTGGGGGVTFASPTTSALGIATVGSWTLGTAAGANTLQATTALALTGEPVTFTATGTADAAQNIAVNAGNGQSATVNTAVAAAPSVRVSDQFNNPVSGVDVTFAVTGGGGAVSPTTAITTNASGIATVSSWTLGQAAGANALQATTPLTLAGEPVAFSATGTAGNAATIAINGGNGQSATVNTTVATAPSVLVTDTFGNPKSGVNVTFAVTGGGGVVNPITAIVTDASGLAQVTSWRLGTVVAANTLQATSAGLTGSPLTFTATGTAGVAFQIAMNAGNSQSATVNTAVSIDPSARVTDQFGNPKSGTAVTFAVTGGGGGATGGAQTTNAAGIATVGSWTLGSVAGTNTLAATSAGLVGSPLAFTATGTAGAPSAINSIVSASPTGITASTGSSASTVTVTVRDQFNNPVPNASVTLLSTGSANAITQPANTNASGQTTGTISSTVAQSKTVTAQANAVSITDDAIVTVSPAAASLSRSLVGATSPIMASVGLDFSTVTVTVRDAFDNPRSGHTITLGVSGTNNTIIQPSLQTNSAGQTTGLFNTTKAETKTVTATIAGVGLILDNAIVLVGPSFPAISNSLVDASEPITASTGSSVSTVTVTVRDQFSNPVSGVLVTIGVTGSNNTVIQPTSATNASGVATGSWHSTFAESKTVSAVVTGAGTIAQTDVVAVNAATPSVSASSVNSAPEPITASTGSSSSTVTVTVRDVFNNPVSGRNVTIAVTGSGNAIIQPTVTTNSSGVTTGSWSSTVAQTKTVSGFIVSIGTITQTDPVIVNAAAASLSNSLISSDDSFIIASNVGSISNTRSVVTVTVRDAFGNPRSGHTVTFTPSGANDFWRISTTNATLSNVTTSNSSGQAQRVFNSTFAQAKFVSGTISGLGSKSVIVTVDHAAATTTACFAGCSTQTAIVGAAVPTDPAMRVTDAFGNFVDGVSVTFSVLSGGGSRTGANQVTNSSGVATVTSWTLGETGSLSSTGRRSNSLRATSTGLTSRTFNGDGIYSLSTHVQPIWNANCSSCHNWTRATTLGVNASCDSPNNNIWDLVAAGGGTTAETRSVIMHRMDGNTSGITGCNSVMPPSGSISATFRNRLRGWIRNGAPNN